MKTTTTRSRIYDGEGDRLMEGAQPSDRIMLVPDAGASRQASEHPRLRIMWGQNLLEDLVNGHYHSLICSVNPHDNSRGIISQIASLLPTSQWDEHSVTEHAKRFDKMGSVTVIKYDMDMVEVLALLRPSKHPALTLEDLTQGFRIAAQMIQKKTDRKPAATVSFLGGRANKLIDETGQEPSFETVLQTMYGAGFVGDVYPAPWMWKVANVPVFARYPFPESLDSMREGGS